MRKLFFVASVFFVALPALGHPVFGKRGMVVSASDLASQAGLQILQKGGNAADAAVTTALVMSVTRPYYASLGGGGFIIARFNKEIMALDHRERAPLRSTRSMFVKAAKKDASENGGLAVATPGNVRGLYELHQKYGKLPWASLVAPAIQYAENGFMVTEEFARITNDGFKNFNTAGKKYFSNRGHPLEVGDTFRQPQLAKALRIIQKDKAAGFYTGDIAMDIARTVIRDGGIMTIKDLSTYHTRWMKPLHELVMGADVYSMPPPSSGGTLLIEELKIADRIKVSDAKPYSASELHQLGEIMARAFFDRQYIADPDVMKYKPTEIYSDERVRRWAQSIDAESKTKFDPEGFKMGAAIVEAPPKEQGNTTHYVTVDSEGNAVSATTTVNGEYGSGVFSDKYGINLNNEMDDFTTKPGEANMFGLTQSSLNEIAPGKTPLSSMTPTIIEKDGKLFMAVGSPGGPRIINAVFQVVLRALTSSLNLDEIIQAPRVHHQYSPDKLLYDRMLSPDTTKDLIHRGHAVEEGRIAKVYGVRVTPQGLLEGAFDSRGEGGASGY